MVMNRLFLRSALGVALALAALPGWASLQRTDIFPVEKLSPADRARAEALLLEIMDNEGLYTVVGGLKPISSGFVSHQVPLGGMNREEFDKALASVEADRLLLRKLSIPGQLEFSVLPYFSTSSGRRALEGFVLNQSAVSAAIQAHPGLFGFWGGTPSTPPSEVIMAFESDPTPARFRAFGYLFGYPKHAVDFFADAEITRRETGDFVKREFFQIPAYSGESGRYVYAVPVGYVPTEVDLNLRTRAIAILEEYKTRRAQHVGEGKPGIVELLRDWMHSEDGSYRFEEMEKKVGRRWTVQLSDLFR
jgi:hypothetical protein